MDRIPEIDNALYVLSEPQDGKKGVICVSFYDIEPIWAKYCDYIKNFYWVVGMVSGTSTATVETLRHKGHVDLYMFPSASFKQDVLRTYHAHHYARGLIIDGVESKSEYTKEHPEKQYDFITVMNFAHQKLWGMICDLAEEMPDKKFMATANNFGNHNYLIGEEYKQRLLSLPNVEIKKSAGHFEYGNRLRSSKVMIHACDYDPGIQVIGEAMVHDVPVLLPVNASSAARRLISPRTGLFFRYHELREKARLALELVSEGFFSPAEEYRKKFGPESFLERIEKALEFYGFGNYSLSFPKEGRSSSSGLIGGAIETRHKLKKISGAS
jgi:hypothetical protein